MNRAEEIRRILNIHYCHGPCQQDTMPFDATGCCAWCETKLCNPVGRGEPCGPDQLWCAHCGNAIPDDKPARYNRRYCSERCRQRNWDSSPAGIEYRFVAARRRLEQKRARRAAGAAG